jgi:hypothetical protein
VSISFSRITFLSGVSRFTVWARSKNLLFGVVSTVLEKINIERDMILYQL